MEPNEKKEYSIITSGNLYKRLSLEENIQLGSLRKDLNLKEDQLFFKSGTPYTGNEDTTVNEFADIVTLKDGEKSKEERQIEFGTFFIKVVRKGKPLTLIPLKITTLSGLSLKDIRENLKKEMKEWERFLIKGAPCRTEDENSTLVKNLVDSKGEIEIGLPKTDPLPPKLPIPELPNERNPDKKEKPSAELPSQVLDIVAKEVIASENVDDITELSTEERHRVVESNLILHGIDIRGAQPRISAKPALMRKTGENVTDIIFLRQDQTEITAELTYTDRGKNLVESGFQKVDAGLTTPWVAASVEASLSERRASDHKERKCYTTGRWQCQRAIVIINEKSVMVTEDLRQAVKKIILDTDLTDDVKYDRLRGVFDEYGHVIPTRVTLGAELVQTKQETSSADVTEFDREGKMRACVSADTGSFFSAKAGVAIEKSKSETTTEKENSSRSQYSAKGGNTLFATDPVHWLDSVKHWKNWRIIRYEEVQPIYMFFEKEIRDIIISIVNARLQSEIGSIWGMSMLPNGTMFVISGRDQSLWRLDGLLGFWQKININTASIQIEYPNRFSDVAALSNDLCILLNYQGNTLVYAKIEEGKADILLYHGSKDCVSYPGNAIASLPSGCGFIVCPPAKRFSIPSLLRCTDFSIENVNNVVVNVYHRLDMAPMPSISGTDDREILSIACFDNDKYVILYDLKGKKGSRKSLMCLHASKGEWKDIKLSEDLKIENILCIGSTTEDELLVVPCEKVNEQLFPYMFISKDEKDIEERHGWCGNKIVKIKNWDSSNPSNSVVSNFDVSSLRKLALL